MQLATILTRLQSASFSSTAGAFHPGPTSAPASASVAAPTRTSASGPETDVETYHHESGLSTPASAISAAYSSDFNPPSMTPTLPPGVTHDPLAVAYTTAAAAPGMMHASPQYAGYSASGYAAYPYAPAPPTPYGQPLGPSHSVVGIPQQQQLQHHEPWEFAGFVGEPPTSMPTGHGYYVPLEHSPRPGEQPPHHPHVSSPYSSP